MASGFSAKFGKADPVIVRLESNEHVVFAAKLAQIATRTHERVFIGVVDPDPKKSTLCLIPVSPAPATFTISAVTKPTGYILPVVVPNFDAPPGAEQLRKIEKTKRGKIP